MNLLDLFSIPTALAASITDQGSTTATETTSGLTEFFNTIWNQAPSWIAAMIVFACSFIVAKITKEKVLDRVSAKMGEDDQDVLTLIGRATYVAVLMVGITIALKIAGIDLTAIVAAVGFGLGFAMQDLIMNFLAGILILVNRQFTIGDFIKINDTIGQVMEIQSRATILKALDGTRVIVPNSDLFTNQVTSFTSNPFRRIEVPVGVEYRTDLGHAQQIIREALKEHHDVLQEPGPAIVINEFADSSINFLVRFWVDSKSKWVNTRSEVIHIIKERFDEEGIGIPFPIRTLAFDKDTEDVVMPTYQVPAEDLKVHKDKRAHEEEDLANQIAAAAERAKIQDIQPVKPTPAPEVGVGEEEIGEAALEGGFAETEKAEAVPEADGAPTDGEEVVTGEAIVEDVAGVAVAAEAVQAKQETEEIPTVTAAEKEETGAAFLRSN